MAVQKNFLADSMQAFRSKFESLAEYSLPEGRQADDLYHQEAAENLRQSEKHFMWGEASKILTMMMSAVLMGGVTGAAIKVLAGAGTLGMGALALGGIVLAGAAMGAAYLSFKSQGKNGVNSSETYANMLARTHAKELTPTLSKAIATEIGAEVRTALKDTVQELRVENQAMLAGAANTNGTVQAGIGNTLVSFEKAQLPLEKEFAARVANDDVKPTINIIPIIPITDKPQNRTQSQQPIEYGGKALAEEKMLEPVSVRQ